MARPLGKGFFVFAAERGDVDLTPQDTFDPFVPSSLEEIDGAEDISMVGECHCRHLELGGSFNQFGRFDGSIQKAEIGVSVEVYK